LEKASWGKVAAYAPALTKAFTEGTAMADSTQHPESLENAIRWSYQARRLEVALQAEADAMATLPSGPHGSIENNNREAAVDFFADLINREAMALVASPAPDLAAVMFKINEAAAGRVEIDATLLEAIRDDLARLSRKIDA
jgi:hypothetical protein